MNFALSQEEVFGINIKVVGVGGGGGNAVNRMIGSGIRGVEFIAMNTDAHILKFNKATYKLQLGNKLTKGTGAGGNPDIGKRAAEESIEDITAALKGASMTFITAGMGGGTGSGAAPVVAKIAKEMGILTIGIVTKPFIFEGKRKMEIAEEGISQLGNYVDSIVVIPNERLKLITTERITLSNAFEMADSVLVQGVQSISDLINTPGYINLDFADVTAVMKDSGYAHMGVGRASGIDKATTAATMAISSPLLETTINGARGVLINVSASPDIDLSDIDQAATMITNATDPNANIVWGAVFDETLADEMSITVIATGFDAPPTPASGYTFPIPTALEPVKVEETGGPDESDFDSLIRLLNDRSNK